MLKIDVNSGQMFCSEQAWGYVRKLVQTSLVEGEYCGVSSPCWLCSGPSGQPGTAEVSSLSDLVPRGRHPRDDGASLWTAGGSEVPALPAATQGRPQKIPVSTETPLSLPHAHHHNHTPTVFGDTELCRAIVAAVHGRLTYLMVYPICRSLSHISCTTGAWLFYTNLSLTL